MASYENCKVVNMTAGEDLRSDLYEILKIENDSGVSKVIKTAAATDVVVGVLAENPSSSVSTDGYNVPVAVIGGGGKGFVKAGAAITAGNFLVPDSTGGRAAGVANLGALAADQMAFGIALETAADGEVFEALFGYFAAPHSS